MRVTKKRLNLQALLFVLVFFSFTGIIVAEPTSVSDLENKDAVSASTESGAIGPDAFKTKDTVVNSSGKKVQFTVDELRKLGVSTIEESMGLFKSIARKNQEIKTILLPNY